MNIILQEYRFRNMLIGLLPFQREEEEKRQKMRPLNQVQGDGLRMRFCITDLIVSNFSTKKAPSLFKRKGLHQIF